MKKYLEQLVRDERGIGTIEIILILVVIYTQMLAGQVWGIP